MVSWPEGSEVEDAPHGAKNDAGVPVLVPEPLAFPPA
jgi:hypothetical protein